MSKNIDEIIQKPIKFISQSSLIELLHDINENYLIYANIPLEFNYFSIFDALLEYMGELLSFLS